jgi:hypothetical protein
MLGKQQNNSRGNWDIKQYQGMQKLTVQQLLGSVLICLFMKWDENVMPFLQATNTFRSALCYDTALNYTLQGWGELRSALTPLLSDKDGTDLSLMTLDFAKKNIFFVYELITKFEIPKENQGGSVERQFSDALPIITIKLCRSCRKCEGSEIKLSMCRVCVDNRDYSDIHWFCSSVCEEKALAGGHLEEHDHFLMLKLGLVKF